MNSRLWATAIVSFLIVGSVFATQQRSFVSSTGTDSNPCTRDLPCRTFAAAIAQTNANGEVVAIDSAGYGPFSVAKGIAIIAAPGVHAGISVFSGSGVTVNAPGSVVVLRNLYVNSQGGTIGIAVSDAANLHIEHCTVTGFTTGGIQLQPQAIGSSATIDDSTVRDTSPGYGVLANGAVSSALVAVNHCTFSYVGSAVVADRAVVSVFDSTAQHCQNGFYARGTASAAAMSVSRSKVFQCGSGVVALSGSIYATDVESTYCVYGFAANSVNAGLTLERCVSNNTTTHNVSNAGGLVTIANSVLTQSVGDGVNNTSSGYVRVSHCTITDNGGAGLDNVSGTVTSTGDNLVEGNGSNSTGTITPANKM